ncbi:MAG: hypothetical protein JNK75_03425 [Betaproteobacteria bacterium]|nr:hypothetical protein [Betaproteobacteria bacterium]
MSTPKFPPECNTTSGACGPNSWPMPALPDKFPPFPSGCLAGEILVNGVCRHPELVTIAPEPVPCLLEPMNGYADVWMAFAFVMAKLVACR